MVFNILKDGESPKKIEIKTCGECPYLGRVDSELHKATYFSPVKLETYFVCTYHVTHHPGKYSDQILRTSLDGIRMDCPL